MNPLMIRDWPLPYVERLAERQANGIDLVVIHCTELPDMAMAREFGERIQHPESATGNSGHYYIDRDGSISRFVGELRVAHHTFRFNPRSIGIELVNSGRYPDWLHSQHQQMTEAYPAAQIDALLALLADLRQRCPQLVEIAGHEDLDVTEVESSDDPDVKVRRKRDPGPMFPWSRVADSCGLQRRMAA